MLWLPLWVHASRVTWSDYTFTTQYDESDDELEILFSTFSNGDPREDYTLELDLWSVDCDMDLEYKSFYVKWDCKIDIDSDDILWEYDATFEVFNEDDEEVYNRTFDLELDDLEDSFDWDDLEYSADYIQEDEELELVIYLDNITRQPIDNYEIFIELDGDDYDDRFTYKDSEDRIEAKFTLDIDEDDIENDYDIDYEILNSDEDEVQDSRLEIDVDILSNEDEFDWDDIEYSSEYDEDGEDLLITFTLEGIDNAPNSSYEVVVEIDDEEEDKRFTYSSSQENLTAIVKFWIDEDDIEDEYDMEFTINNRDEDERELKEDVEIEVWESSSNNEKLDWDDIEISLAYDEDEEVLYVVFELDVESRPNIDFEVDFELDGEDYDDDFSYDSSDERLYAEFQIDIDEDDIEDEYEIDYEITDEDRDDVADDRVDVDVEEYKQIAESNIDWENLQVDFRYDERSENLIVNFVLEEIDDEPKEDYIISFELESEGKLTGRLLYDEDDEVLSNFFYIQIDEDDLESSYSIDLEIENEDNDTVYEIEKNYSFDAPIKSNQLTDARKAVINTVLVKYTNNIFKRYFSEQKATDYIERVIASFTAYWNANTQHKEVLDYCVEIFRDILSKR